jgi:hypothetical protein
MHSGDEFADDDDDDDDDASTIALEQRSWRTTMSRSSFPRWCHCCDDEATMTTPPNTHRRR